MADTISSPDLPKNKRNNVGNMKDMISNLPDGILHYILSLLSTKEAVGTSVLSPKWRYLWTQLSTFDFKIPHPLYKTNHQNQNSANCLLDLVGKLLHKSNHIERLGIEILRITIDGNKVSSLISSAVKHNVHDLQLSIDDRKYLDTKYVLPNCFSASKSLNKLVLQLGFLLYIPDGICFSTLKILNLSYVRFGNEKSVQQLFSGCPVLEELTLYKCVWEHINHITISISSLRTLAIHSDSSCLDYDHYDCCTVTIHALNIVSLTCTSTPTLKFVLVNPISIIDANIGLEFDYPQNEVYAANSVFELLSGLSAVKSLTLTSDTFQCLYFSVDTLHLLPLFHNLTHLHIIPSGDMEFTLEVLLDILHKTPKLEVLDIPMVFCTHLEDEDLTINSVPCCFKSSLKSFCISKFYGYEAEIRLIKLLLENATMLEEMKISFLECLSSNLKHVTDVKNQLKPLDQGRCVLTMFQ